MSRRSWASCFCAQRRSQWISSAAVGSQRNWPPSAAAAAESRRPGDSRNMPHEAKRTAVAGSEKYTPRLTQTLDYTPLSSIPASELKAMSIMGDLVGCGICVPTLSFLDTKTTRSSRKRSRQGVSLPLFPVHCTLHTVHTPSSCGREADKNKHAWCCIYFYRKCVG